MGEGDEEKTLLLRGPGSWAAARGPHRPCAVHRLRGPSSCPAVGELSGVFVSSIAGK